MKMWILVLITFQLVACGNQMFCGEIHDAAQRGDLDKVHALVKEHIDLVSSRNDSGLTPLMLAAAGGHTNLVAFLLVNKSDISARDNAGQTALHWAVSSREEPIVIMLLTNKAEINVRNNSGWTPLHYAAAFTFGETNIVNLLLANGADVNAKCNDGKTPLHLAAMYGFPSVVKIFINNKGDVNVKDGSNQTPLAAALDMNALRMDMIKIATPGKKAAAEILRQHGGF